MTTVSHKPKRSSRPEVSLDDALNLWDVLTTDERRQLFANVWDALAAFHAGDPSLVRSLAESLPVMVLVEKLQPGFRAMARESLARGPVPAHQLVNVDDVTRMLRS